jgi:hypothetical protein
MHSTPRTLLILGAIAVGGVSALGYGAYRYSRVLEDRLPSAEDARARVEAFVEVRRGMRGVIDAGAVAASPAPALAAARDRAIAAGPLDAGAYDELRRAYRAWRAGELRAGSTLGSAFESRRRDLDRVDLGPYESLDS